MAQRREKFDESRLEVIVTNEIKASVAYDRDAMAELRRDALEYIEGKMTRWPAEEGRSSVVDMTTLDTISWILPAIIRLFFASDQMVVAEPESRKDEEWAKQATAGLNYDFRKRNDGYAIFYDVTFNALLHGDGIVKHWWDDTPITKTSFHSQLSEEQFVALQQPEDTGITEEGEPEEEVELLAYEECIYTLEPGDEGYVDPAVSLHPLQQQQQLLQQMPGGGLQGVTRPPPPGGGQPLPEGMPSPPSAPGGMPPSSGMPPVPAASPRPPAEPQDAQQPQGAPDIPLGMEIAPYAATGQPADEVSPRETRMTQKGRSLGPNEHVYYDAKIKRTVRHGRMRWSAIAPENFVINKGAVSLAKARVIGDREEMTRSDLVEMGFDYDKVMSLSADATDNTDAIARDNGSMSSDVDQPLDNTMMETVWLYELYLKIDVDDDGIAETIQCHYADNGGMGVLLDWQVWEDEELYSQISTYRVPHRWNSNGLFTRTRDIQEIKTVLARNTLDSLYSHVNPQKVVRGRVLNPDELTNPSFGGSILMESATDTVEQLVIPFVGDATLQTIQYFDDVVQKRTGVSRTTMSLDPEALQNSTATASQLAHDASYAQIELIARNHSELGWKHAFTQALKLTVRHQRRKETIRIADQKYVEIDPRQWNADMSIEINTGLGTGSRDRDIAVLSSVKADQVAFAQVLREAKLAGRALEMVPRIATSLRKSAEAAGIRNVDQFYPEITPQDLQEAAQVIQQANSQPPPEAQLMQMDIQGKMQLKQLDVEVKKQELQLKATSDASKEAAQMQADLEVKDKEMARDLTIADNQQTFEREKLAVEARQKELDRAQQLRIELLKINAQERNAAAMRTHEATSGHADRSFKADSEKRSSRAKQDEMLIAAGKEPRVDGVPVEDSMKAMHAMAEKLSQSVADKLSAPKRIVRDPKTGRAIGIEVVQ